MVGKREREREGSEDGNRSRRLPASTDTTIALEVVSKSETNFPSTTGQREILVVFGSISGRKQKDFLKV